MLGVAGVALLVVAVLLGAFAFTIFGRGVVPDPSSPAYREFAAQRIRQTRWSVALGFGASLALLGALACMQSARRGSSAVDPGRQPPAP